MASKDIKSHLKEAREAVNNKEFAKASTLCKIILNKDKTNYIALVLQAVCLQELGDLTESLKLLKQAIQQNESNILAWNGLASYYEKVHSADYKIDLSEVYLKLLELETVEQKIVKICLKLPELSPNYKDVNIVLSKLYPFSEKTDFSDDSRFIVLEKVCLLSNEHLSTLNNSSLQLYKDSLGKLLDNKSYTCLKYHRQLLSLYHKLVDFNNLFEHSTLVHNLYNEDTVCLEWICKCFNEYSLLSREIPLKITENISEFTEKLLKLDENSSMGIFTKGMILFYDNKALESRDLLRDVVKLRPGLIHAWILLSKCFLKLRIYDDANDCLEKVNSLLKSSTNDNLQKIVDLLYCEALTNSTNVKSMENGIEMCKNFINNDNGDSDSADKFKLYLLNAYISNGQITEANTILDELKNSSLRIEDLTVLKSKLHRKENDFKKSLEVLKLLENNTCDYWLELGLVYWELSSYKECLIPFIKATKAEPNNYRCMLYLGDYYTKLNDLERSRRCYEKCFKLNPNCPDIAVKLSNIYREQSNSDANLLLLRNLTTEKINSKNCWAFLQLGLTYLEQNNYELAIDNLRMVIRFSPENKHHWDCLADAYMARGSYNSALNCYERSVELDSTHSLYPLLQIANIKQLIEEYTEAISDFQAVLKLSEHYVPALKGLAQTCLSQARQYKRKELVGLARDSAQMAMDAITLALSQRSELSCLWKLAADSCYLVATLPLQYSCILVLATLATGKDIPDKIGLDQDELFLLAARCYSRAITLTEDDNIPLYHDLATCYVTQGIIAKRYGDEFTSFLDRAMEIVRYCVKAAPNNTKHWNLMGVIAFLNEPSDYSLAQHSFIKAVTLNRRNVHAWTNLGALYLHRQDLQLANKAFAEAQREDPSYVNGWVGQAMLAEVLNHEDTMNLYRHTIELGSHFQGALGYAQAVCSTILKSTANQHIYVIENMHAVSVACDALTWYTEKVKENPDAWNMLGILQERLGLKSNAAKSYQSALKFSAQNRDKINTNLGRILYSMSNYPKSIEVFNSVKEATLNSGIGLALSYFKNEDYELSYNSYESALNWLTEDSMLQSELLVALATMAYLFQGPNEAKTLLLQSAQLSPRSPWSLYATLSLGLLQKDTVLSQLVLKELHEYWDDPKCKQHYATLLVCTYLLKGDKRQGLRALCRLVHRHPGEGSLWLNLAILLLRYPSEEICNNSAIAKCAQVAMKLGQNNMDVTKVLSLVSLAMTLTGNHKEALKAAQKSIHCYPTVADNWAVFITSQSKLSINKANIKANIGHVINNLSPNERMLNWLNYSQQCIC